MHRIGGSDPDDPMLTTREMKLNPSGISVPEGEMPAEVTALMRKAPPNATSLHKAADCAGMPCITKIQQAGFDVMPDPTRKLPNHHRLILRDGAAEFTPENLKKLSDAFADTTGN